MTILKRIYIGSNVMQIVFFIFQNIKSIQLIISRKYI